MERFGWLPPEWTAYGARWGKDNHLYLGEWRHGFDVHQLRALFFECQQIRSLRHELASTKKELEDATEAIETLRRRVRWYRRIATGQRLFYITHRTGVEAPPPSPF
jgi:hypothetical protein